MNTNITNESVNDSIFWRGSHLNTIYKSADKWNLTYWPPVIASDKHKVLYHIPIIVNGLPPKPQVGQTKWDANHVRLPFSNQSQYPVKNHDGSVTLERRWELVQKALLRPILNSKELEKAIISYNTKYEKSWKFHALHRLFEEELEEEESDTFFQITLPKIIDLALQLPNLIPNSIPLLKQEQNRSISLTQQQIGCLLANAFLCTYPRRNTKKKNSEYFSFPDINFNRLFQGTEQKCIEKLKCICNYFTRICTNAPTDVVTFCRRSVSEKNFPNWNESNLPLSSCMLHVSSKGTIEDNGLGMLQVDFANRFIGGGVLGGGSVQEEIRFVICPELLISRLFTESMKPTEALFIIGCEQFNKYDGYASSFSWNGNFCDETPLDECRRRKCHIVAIDALRFIHTDHQFKEELMLRELKKAFVGYYYPPQYPSYAVASGNWGCGAYKGESHLKFLIQLMVCCAVKRPLVYFTFDDQDLQNSIYEMYEFLCLHNCTIAELWKHLKDFRRQELPPKKLYQFIYKQFQRPIMKDTVIYSNENGSTSKSTTRNEIHLKHDNISSITTIMEKKEAIETSLFDINKEKISNHFNFIKHDKTNKKIMTSAGPSQTTPSLLSCLDQHYNSSQTNEEEFFRGFDNEEPNKYDRKAYCDKTRDKDQNISSMEVDTELQINETPMESETIIDDNLNERILTQEIINSDDEYIPASPVKISGKKMRSSDNPQASSSVPPSKSTTNWQPKILDFFKQV